jgi:hypothetical protein
MDGTVSPLTKGQNKVNQMLFFHVFLAKIAFAQHQEREKFIDAGCVNPLFRGAKPIYMGDFNKLVDEHYKNANFLT